MTGAGKTKAPAADSLHSKLFGILTGTNGDTALDKAAALLELASWIESARYLTKAVCREADIHVGLAQALKAADVRINTALWEDEHVDGLLYLHMAIRDEIEAARKAMQEALAVSREAGR